MTKELKEFQNDKRKLLERKQKTRQRLREQKLLRMFIYVKKGMLSFAMGPPGFLGSEIVFRPLIIALNREIQKLENEITTPEEYFQKFNDYIDGFLETAERSGPYLTKQMKEQYRSKSWDREIGRQIDGIGRDIGRDLGDRDLSGHFDAPSPGAEGGYRGGNIA